VGALLRSDDIVLVESGSSVWILCANLETDEISNTPRSPRCSPEVEGALFMWGELPILERQRNNGYENVLYVITPRNTALLYGTPRIEWSSIANAANYSVQIILADGTEQWIAIGITDTWLDYPAARDPLHALDNAGNPLEYQIIVTAYDSSNTQIATRMDPGQRENIRVLPPEGRVQTEDTLSRLDGISMPNGADPNVARYSRALFFFNSHLYADSLQIVSELLSTPISQPFSVDTLTANSLAASPFLYFLLGDLYGETQLPVEAQCAYGRALMLAERDADVNAEAQAHALLAHFSSEARAHYEYARGLYGQLGDTATMALIDEALATVQAAASTDPMPTADIYANMCVR
jgi:tetratricopeptide (TPR) repeat protein